MTLSRRIRPIVASGARWGLETAAEAVIGSPLIGLGVDVVSRFWEHSRASRITIEGRKIGYRPFDTMFTDERSRSIKYELRPEDFYTDRALQDARQAWVDGAHPRDVEEMVDSLHVINVVGNNPHGWHFDHLGMCTYASQVTEPAIRGIPYKSFREQAMQSYFSAKISGEPAYDVVTRITDKPLTYRRLINPELDDNGRVRRVVVFVAVEHQAFLGFSVRQPKIRRWTADCQPPRDYPNWLAPGIAFGKSPVGAVR